jgi:hypothetical protein
MGGGSLMSSGVVPATTIYATEIPELHGARGPQVVDLDTLPWLISVGVSSILRFGRAGQAAGTRRQVGLNGDRHRSPPGHHAITVPMSW